MKRIIYITLIVNTMIASCTAPEVGYISDNIHALEDTIFVSRGLLSTSAAPAREGSTYPLHWEITGITDNQGNPTQALQETHEIITWKEAFNGETDTTLASAQEKIELSDEPSILINSVSGEFAFTPATKFVENDIFRANVKASNVRGERQLDDFVIIKLEEFKPVEFPVEMRSRLQLGKEDGQWDIGYTSVITGDNDPGVPSVLDGTHPYITVQKIGKDPELGVTVKMIIEDSYGNPLNPKKVVFYPDNTSFSFQAALAP